MTWLTETGRKLLSRISGQNSTVSTGNGGSSGPDEETVHKILQEIVPIAEADNWTAAKSISGLSIKDSKILLALMVSPHHAETLEPVRKHIEAILCDLPGIDSVQVMLTAEAAAGQSAPPPQTEQSQQQAAKKIGQHATGKAIELPGVKQVIAIASGKGGVGKSTTTANLAIALAQKGLKVGVLDADIYGPSIPTLFGCEGEQPAGNSDGLIIPIEKFGMKMISIGFMVPADAAMIWRGPMASGAIEQLFRDVDWGELDVLLVDLPPGTGDIQITMAQKAPLTGAIIVSTPQDLALIDTKRALTMFGKVGVPVHGFVENMSYYQCPQCGHQEHIFDHGGTETTAEEMGAIFLGAVPLTMAIREASDGGEPITSSNPTSPQAAAYNSIADKVLETIGE